MGRLFPALVALMLALPSGNLAAAPMRAAAQTKAAKAKRVARSRPPVAAKRPTFAAAAAAMKALQRDRTKRRYRHHWERAIRNLERAARGRDASPALLEAARARYALYRWSAIESDRDAAVTLARRAAKLGSREAPALVAAIRREAGDDAQPAPKRKAPAASPAPSAATAARVQARMEAEDEAPPEPALQAALADVSGAGGAHALSLGESGGEGPAQISEIKTWASADYTRVAVYLSHWTGWHKLELAPGAGQPRRLALDFRPATLAAKVARTVEGEQVERVRAAQNDPETVRVVLDLPGHEKVQLFGLDDPPRLIIDVGTRGNAEVATAPQTSTASPTTAIAPQAPISPPSSTSTASNAAAAPTAADAQAYASPSTPPALPPAPSPATFTSDVDEGFGGPVRRIVVDAGHGGHDPGAIGPRRVREKDVTLAIANRLARKLRDAGFEVVLTRNRDRYLALEERTAIANTARGDLFVSIHANAHPRRNREGIETYYLNVADDRYAARLAARENGLDFDEGSGVLTRILTDLETKASAGASRRLAQHVQREVTTSVRARVGDVRDLGVKGALFYVLLGARMPAVLVETAFVSNRVEERRLASTRYQDVVASGIARAVTAYARSEARVAAVR